MTVPNSPLIIFRSAGDYSIDVSDITDGVKISVCGHDGYLSRGETMELAKILRAAAKAQQATLSFNIARSSHAFHNPEDRRSCGGRPGEHQGEYGTDGVK